MKISSVCQRLSGLGGAKWDLHLNAKAMVDRGQDVILMTIGEPDVETPQDLQNFATERMRAGRTGYSDGRGEQSLRIALADYYSHSCHRHFTPGNVLCFPGTQTALFAVLMGVAEAGDEILVADPLYVTYEGVIRAPGSEMVPVPLRPEHGFRIQAQDIAARITPRSRAILLNTPHNPTGAVLTQTDIAEIGTLAKEHDLWIISDEVYEHLIFDDVAFASPLSMPELADRVIVVSSISKSHAAPGFRSGWCIGPEAFCTALLPFSETMLFGNQPFIADMTEYAIKEGSPVAEGMRRRFAGRAQRLSDRLHDETAFTVHQPQAGMFALIDIASTGMSSDAYAQDLLSKAGVAVMPGSAFGDSLQNWVRVALTIADAEFDTAVDRIADHAASIER